MIWIAWKMLTGDKAKYLGLVFGVTFASVLMSQQVSIFVGLMARTTAFIKGVNEARVWVMDEKVRYYDEVVSLSDTDLSRVRGVDGVKWAVPYFKGQLQARLVEESGDERGQFRQVILIGLDDTSLVGAPRELLAVGGFTPDPEEALRRPDAVIMDEAGYGYLWPGQPLRLGRVLEINDRRAVIVGICKTNPSFLSFPVVYARYSNAMLYAPPQRRQLSYVLAEPEPGVTPEELVSRVNRLEGLKARTYDDFRWDTIGFYMESTGIPVNFGITVTLGFVIGVAIAGQTFYLFTVENLKQFGALKAMGLSNARLLAMILCQAAFVGVVGYGIGTGLAALFFTATGGVVALAGFYMPWQIMAGTGAAVALIVALASLVSARKVLVLEPAVVFR